MNRLVEVWRRLTGPIGVGALLVVWLAALVASVAEKSPAMDEPLHLTAGYTYWTFQDYRIQPENGILPQRWFGLALLGAGFQPPAVEAQDWQDSRQWNVAYHWLHSSGNDPAHILKRGRFAAALLTVALGFVIWCWSRRLFGPTGGFVSLLVCALDPTILANGALATSDVAGALFFLLALWTAARALETFSPGRVLASAVALSGLFLAKMSAPLVLPVLAVMLAARVLAPAPLSTSSGRLLTTRTAKGRILALGIALHVAAVFVAIWAAYGFRFRAFAVEQATPPQFDYVWEWALDRPDHFDLVNRLELSPEQAKQVTQIFTERGATFRGWTRNAVAALAAAQASVLTPAQAQTLARLRDEAPPSPAARLVAFAHRHQLLPEAYLYGYAHVWKLSRARTSFLNGEVSNTGWRHFFPFTFLVKTPIATQLLLLGAACALVAVWRAPRGPGERETDPLVWLGVLPLGAFAAVYGGAAILSHINIGHRHILPLYPAMFILCGAAGRWLELAWERGADPTWRRPAATGAFAAAVVVLAVESATWFPHYLSYFNGLVRPARAYRHLVDSSLDWGQDLPSLRRYLDQHPPSGRAYLAYFGMGRPTYYGITTPQIFGHLGFEVVAQPALRVLPDLLPERDRAQIDAYRQREPVYDPALTATVQFGQITGALLVKRPDALRLAGGTYFISATLVQPITYSKASGPWSARHEEVYQRLRAVVRPLLDDDVRTRAAALGNRSAIEWLQAFDDFNEFRFARLTAFLRQREPDTTINYSILVYRLSDADIARALDGPPP